jgi:hypothetical protein
MADDPDTLAGIFGLLKLVNHPGKDARVVGVGGVDEVEVVFRVPKI